MKKRATTWLLVAAGVTAIANADVYPFMPFGLFGVVGLTGVGLWLWRDPRRAEQKPRMISWRLIVSTLLLCLVLPLCMKMAVTIHLSVAIQNRVLWNCCVLGVTALLAILHVTDRKANEALAKK
ncbi:MAG: hypothetical protein ACOYOU_13740 [Kiritimatiellia bacterium]